jgi:hypothetical protein
MKHLLAFVALAACVPYAAAQQARPDPADPEARVPQAAYDSAFVGYTPYREQDLAAWRDVNDEVARVGGHVRIFGGVGHGGAKSAPAKPAPAQPAANQDQPAGPRSAPQASQAGHKGH